MKASSRIIVNTAAQYTRTLINVILSLWSSRLILVALGESDFGIYSLVAGIVSMLSFIVNALTQSTQRYISYYQGKKNIQDVNRIFNNSLILHVIIGLLLIFIFEVLSFFLFDGFLNIPAERIGAAKTIYQFVVLMLFISVLTAPFKALLISHENIIYTSFIEIIDGFLKFILAIILAFVSYDKLIVYGCLMLAINFFNIIAFAIYDFVKYKECRIIGLKSFDFRYIKEIFSFTGWIIYHSLCIVGRTQGLALVINKFYSTLLNAAYGIGIQVSGAVNFVSSSLGNAINPQLVKSEGANNREHVWNLARLQCKYSFLLLSAVTIPILLEMNNILSIWLKVVPEKAGFFASMILIAALINQLTDGLGSAKHAIGNIKTFVLITSTPKLLVIPTVILCLYYGAPFYSLALCYIGAEALSAFIRLPLLKHTDCLDIQKYIKEVIYKCFLPVLLTVFACSIVVIFVNLHLRFLFTFITSVIVLFTSTYFFSMNSTEKNKVKSIFLFIIGFFQKHICRH